MATLTELQKQGIYNLLEDWPIGDAIDYDRIQPISTYEPPEGLPQREKNLLGNENLRGFIHGVGAGNEAPPGNPLGLGKEYGADPGIYVRDINQFQPEWTPGATEEGRVNRELADVVGHEGRHIYFQNNPELLEDLNVTALGNNVNIASEEYNQWLDNRLSESDLFQNRLLTHYMMMDRPGEGKLGTHGLANIFKKAESKFRKHRVDDRNQKFLEELLNRRAGPQAPASRPKETYVSPARPHGDGVGSMPTGTAGRNPWGRADGGRIGFKEGSKKKESSKEKGIGSLLIDFLKDLGWEGMGEEFRRTKERAKARKYIKADLLTEEDEARHLRYMNEMGLPHYAKHGELGMGFLKDLAESWALANTSRDKEELWNKYKRWLEMENLERANIAAGGRVGLEEGGWHPGVGRDERGYQSTHPSYGGNGGGGENNQIAPVKKINISPVVETKYNRDLNLSYPSGKVGLKALTKLGKIQAMLDFKDLLEGEDLESEITYENQWGPTFIGGKFDTEGDKELGVGFNRGNLSIGAYTNLDDINQIGLRYQKTFKDGGLATMFERR